MSNQSNNPCPICGAQMQGGVCQSCSWYEIVFPGTVPESIKAMRDHLIKSIKQIQTQAAAQEEECKKIKTELDENKKKLSEASKLLERERDYIDEANRERSNLQGDLQQANNTIQNLQDELNKCRKERTEWQNRCRELEAKAAEGGDLIGFVLVEDTKRKKQACCPVMKGENTYGSAPSDGHHHRINLLIFGEGFQAKHFSVTESDSHLLLKDLTGGSLKYSLGDIPRRGVYAEGKIINFGDNITIKIFKS